MNFDITKKLIESSLELHDIDYLKQLLKEYEENIAFIHSLWENDTTVEYEKAYFEIIEEIRKAINILIWTTQQKNNTTKRILPGKTT